jgi:hypothetical protein
MIKSECRGDARKIIPKRSISYRLIAECIISTAQQANPKVKGHKDPARAQAIIDKSFVEIHSSFIKNSGNQKLVYYLLFFLDFLALKRAKCRFQVNSPNLKPTIHRLINRLWKAFPVYTFVLSPTKVKGIEDDLSKITFCLVRWILFSVIINTLRQVAELAYLSLNEDLGEKSDKNRHYCLKFWEKQSKIRIL